MSQRRLRLVAGFNVEAQTSGFFSENVCKKMISIKRFLILFIFSVVPYLNSLQCGFVFDDISAVVENLDLRSNRSSIIDLFRHDFWGTSLDREDSHKSYRPLTVLTFRFQYSFSDELNSGHFHAFNVFLHAVVTLLYFILLRSIQSIDSDDRDSTSEIPFWASILFASHPIHVEAVAGVVGRAELLQALFFIVGLSIYIRRNRRSAISSILVLLTASAATLCKEQGITLLGTCFVWDLIAADNGEEKKSFLYRTIVRNLKSDRFWKKISILIFGAISILAIRLRMLKGALPNFAESDNPAASSSNFLIKYSTYAHVWSLNAYLLFCPDRLCADWTMGTIDLIKSIIDWRNISTSIFLLSIAWMSFRFLKSTNESTSKSFFALTGLVLIPFLPASNLFFPVGFVVAERILYLPSFGYCYLIASGYAKLLDSVKNRSPPITILIKLAFWITIAVFCAKCVRRNRDWRDDYSLFTSALKVSIKNAKSFNNVGHVLEKRGESEKALAYFKTATRVQDDDVGSWINVGRIESILGNYLEAESALKKAVTLLPTIKNEKNGETRVAPHHLNVFINLGNLYKNRSRLREAENIYRRAISMRRDFSSAYTNLGDLLMATNRIEEALEIFRSGLKYDEENADLWYNAGVASMKLNRSAEAISNFDRALNLDGDHFLALVNSALLLSEIKSIDIGKDNRLSMERLEKAISLRSSNDSKAASLLVHLGNLQYEAKILEKAERSFEKALEIDSRNKIAALNFAVVRADLGKLIGAVSILENLLETYPNFVKGWSTLCEIYTKLHKNERNGNDYLESTRRCYEKVLVLEKNDNIQARHNLCITLINLMSKEKSRECIEEARKFANRGGKNGMYTIDYVRILEDKFSIAFAL